MATVASASLRRMVTVFTGVIFSRRRSAASCVRSTSPSAIAASALRAASSMRPAASFTVTLAASWCSSAFEALPVTAAFARSTALSAA